MVYIPIDIEKAVKRECKRRRYSDKTAGTYLYCINKFLSWSGKGLGKISKKDVREFLENLSEKNRSGNTMNTYHMAIRFLFEEILERRIWIDIKYSKTPKKIPIVLSKEEITKLFKNIKNNKHKLMIELLYSAGLRVSELINLKVYDLETDKGYGFVRHGKGNKDRIFIIAETLKSKIKKLIEKEDLTSEDYLLRSNRKTRYSPETPRHLIKQACKKAKINKKYPVTL